jgi:hypothetical protein
MVIPIVGVPETIAQGLAAYRAVFCRDEGFEHVSRYVTGLVVSPNKTLQGIHEEQVYEGARPSRRAMHEAVFEAGWESDELMKQHRLVVPPDHQGRGREVISLDWTLVHHERGAEIYGVTKAYDYVARRMSQFQTVVTAVVSNREVIDGLAVEVQEPSREAAERAYLEATMKESYEQMEGVQERLLELVHHLVHRLGYRKRTEIAVELVRQIEAEGKFPQANYAFDNGVLTLELTRLIESCGKHWVTELESSRHINWKGVWRRVDEVAAELRQHHRESFRPVTVRCRNGERKEFWAFTKVVRLKRYGSKRLVIVHETPDLTDRPRFLLTDALYWESGRVIETWSYRWASETFHEFTKQVTGLESAQVRKEEAVKRHFRLSCVAQSLLQRAPASGSTSERFKFAKGKPTFGQRCRTVAREVLHALLKLVQCLLAQGRSTDQVLEVLMPA